MFSIGERIADALINAAGRFAKCDINRSRSLIGRAGRKLCLPLSKIREDLWRAVASERNGYRVELDLLAVAGFVVCMASAGITIPREWITRGMLLAVLERSNEFLYGSFRLSEHANGLSLVLGHICPSDQFTAKQIAEVGNALIVQMEDTVLRLYARDLLIAKEGKEQLKLR